MERGEIADVLLLRDGDSLKHTRAVTDLEKLFSDYQSIGLVFGSKTPGPVPHHPLSEMVSYLCSWKPPSRPGRWSVACPKQATVEKPAILIDQHG